MNRLDFYSLPPHTQAELTARPLNDRAAAVDILSLMGEERRHYGKSGLYLSFANWLAKATHIKHTKCLANFVHRNHPE